MARAFWRKTSVRPNVCCWTCACRAWVEWRYWQNSAAGAAAIPVIILTGHGDVAMAVRALQAGASDFIEKPFDDEDLVNRIEMARTATPAENPELQRYRARFSTLTPRETDVMRDVVAGHSNKIIAHRHGLSPKTIEIHRARVMEKTEAKNLSHLVRMALKAGIDPDSDGG